MEKVQFNVPNLWADHHTLKVREVLTQLPGVTDIVASSAFRMVAMSYDPAVTSGPRPSARPSRRRVTLSPTKARAC